MKPRGVVIGDVEHDETRTVVSVKGQNLVVTVKHTRATYFLMDWVKDGTP